LPLFLFPQTADLPDQYKGFFCSCGWRASPLWQQKVFLSLAILLTHQIKPDLAACNFSGRPLMTGLNF
jgi:hypothetical protein